MPPCCSPHAGHGISTLRWTSTQVARLIRWMTHADPRQRPSAREVLRSDLLPPTVGDEQLTDLLRSLPDKHAPPPGCA